MRWWVITGYGLSVAVHVGLAAGVTSDPQADDAQGARR